jgi:hypothetical protein
MKKPANKHLSAAEIRARLRKFISIDLRPPARIDDPTPEEIEETMNDMERVMGIDAILTALEQRVSALEAAQPSTKPASFRDTVVTRQAEHARGGVDAEEVAAAWLHEHGIEHRGDALLMHLARNRDVLRELTAYMREREAECSSHSFRELMQTLRQFE